MNGARWLGLWLVLLSVASCHTSTCDQSCEGCCTAGECVAGTSRFTCGHGGAECSECPVADLCSGGQCVRDPRIDPDSGQFVCNCLTGCCGADGGCTAGTQREACGVARTVCSVCTEAERCEMAVCTSAACTGCIDLTDVCVNGTTDSACGTGGALCLGCSAGKRCSNGICVDAACNVATCATGCCNLAQRCVTPSTMACGIGGQDCLTCADGQMCKDGLCQ